MQSDVKANHNKFYIMQVLRHSVHGNTILFTRYGRVGDRGVTNTEDGNCIKEYEKTFK
jgi:predicted DNA-binding WGR domain protein